MTLDRRQFLTVAAALAVTPYARSAPTAAYFRLSQHRGRWWLISPVDKPFFSLGLNHVDPATLRYPENVRIWEEKYGSSMERWLKEAVRKDLLDWGFNSVGWAQEVVTRGKTNHRHSRPFTAEEYRWLGLPFCHLLPFVDFHQWEAETRHPDLFSKDWENWCDHVAREHCVPLAREPLLIGYFYVDCPTWVHTRPESAWKGPLFNPDKLRTEDGRKELSRLAERYYRVTHDAVRRYDKNHLLLGDRYESSAPLPDEVVEAAKSFVDVLSFQDFRDPVVRLGQWHKKTGKPVLWADGAKAIELPDGNARNDGKYWGETLAALRKNPGCVGAHLCGAYLRNRTRRRGLRDEQERPDEEMIALIRTGNRDTARWVEDSTAEP